MFGCVLVQLGASGASHACDCSTGRKTDDGCGHGPANLACPLLLPNPPASALLALCYLQAYQELQTTDKAKDMREQQLLRSQMELAYKTGDRKTVGAQLHVLLRGSCGAVGGGAGLQGGWPQDGGLAVAGCLAVVGSTIQHAAGLPIARDAAGMLHAPPPRCTLLCVCVFVGTARPDARASIS